MKFKDSLFSKYEKRHVIEVVSNKKRLDGRSPDEYRKLDIQFGKEWGVCIVSLGETKVMAQVTCEVQQPKTTRPNEGLLFLNVEVSQMAMPGIEQNVLSELHVHLNRLLEKCVKESHCVDLESLCIVAEEKVWNIRVDIIVLNYEGNIVGCSSIAAIAALSHFRRPDVTIDGEKVIIHHAFEKDLIPLSMRHYPLAISFAVFDSGNFVLSDPTDIEERSAQAELVLGMNAYRELCGIHLSGTVLSELNVLLQCAQKAANTAAILVQQIKTAIEIDDKQRKESFVSCLVNNINVDRVLPVSESRSYLFNNLSNDDIKEKADKIVNFTSKTTDKDNEIIVLDQDDDVMEIRPSGKQSAEIVVHKRNKKRRNVEVTSWSDEDIPSDIEDKSSKIEMNEKIGDNIKQPIEEIGIDTSSDEDDIALVKEITTEDRIIERIELTGDSEEEDVVTMMPSDINNVPDDEMLSKNNEIKSESD